MKYTVDYFIKKFEAIPEEMWCVGSYSYDDHSGIHCAYGHCKIIHTLDLLSEEMNEATALSFVLRDGIDNGVVAINDGYDSRYRQPTPKQRILAALQDIKKAQAITYADTVINNIEETKINQPAI